MCVSKPSVPDPVPVQQAPTQQDPVVANAGKESAKRNRAQAGAQATILTQGQTENSVPLLGNTLLGQ